jgi:hypothetical protein
MSHICNYHFKFPTLGMGFEVIGIYIHKTLSIYLKYQSHLIILSYDLLLKYFYMNINNKYLSRSKKCQE